MLFHFLSALETIQKWCQINFTLPPCTRLRYDSFSVVSQFVLFSANRFGAHRFVVLFWVALFVCWTKVSPFGNLVTEIAMSQKGLKHVPFWVLVAKSPNKWDQAMLTETPAQKMMKEIFSPPPGFEPQYPWLESQCSNNKTLQNHWYGSFFHEVIYKGSFTWHVTR